MLRLGVRVLGQALLHTPSRYERQEAESPIGEIVPGRVITARGEVTATRPVRFGRKPRFEAVLMDGTGRLDLVWFHQMWIANKIMPGMRLRVTGEARKRGNTLQLINPRQEVLRLEGDEPEAREARLRPVYPATESFASWQIEKVIEKVLPLALPLLEDHLPAEFRARRELPALAEAYRMVHTPQSEEEAAAGRRRLAFDELLLLQLGVFLRKSQVKHSTRALPLKWNGEIDAHIRAILPFTLTPDQDTVVKEIAADLQKDEPASRLVQGDVGSGKTAVALYALLMAVADGHQGTLMAPTELLAEQHFLSISRMLKDSSVRVELVTGAMGEAERSSALWRLARGQTDIAIGTHALLGKDVRFKSLAVAVVDEQHRFGVEQRAGLRERSESNVGETRADDAALWEKPVPSPDSQRGTGVPPVSIGSSDPAQAGRLCHDKPPERALSPHMIVMTATPIPRTLALTLLGDLDVSTIESMPPGRKPIITRVVPPEKSGEVYAYVRERVDAGDQAYIVVPAIDSGKSPFGPRGDDETERTVNDLRTLQAKLEAPGSPLADKRLAAIHGRLSRASREQVMGRFRAGEIDALIATTVIEVGVDVPNATVIVVEHAERFGLAQLHQLRGRVGRGGKRGICVLIGDTSTPDAAARLSAMAKTSNGFDLAEKDLELRGPGEVFGSRQSGMPPFRVADLMRDRDLLLLARKDAEAWVASSPHLDRPGERLLRTRLLKAHGTWLGLGDVG